MEQEVTLQATESEPRASIQWIDLLRCIAICCVLLTHATALVYTFDLESMTPISASVVFAFTLHSIGRLGVPIFFMITGYLLLDRSYTEGAARFWKKNYLRRSRGTRVVAFLSPCHTIARLSW